MNTEYVTTAKPKPSGCIYRAKFGTALPTSVDDQLNAAFKELGYVSKDGISNDSSKETAEEQEWGGVVVLNMESGKKDQWKPKLIEGLNVEVLKTVYGEDNVTGDLDTGLEIADTNDEAEQFSWVIDMIMKGNVKKRIVIPQAAVTSVAEIVYKADQSVGYGLTIAAVPYKPWSTEKLVTHKEYIKRIA